MYAPTEPAPVVGDVIDDLEDARRDLADTSDVPAVWHAAHHLAGLIRFLAYADAKGMMV
jgi:hypothetical protein